ncbi:MAG: arylsulfatase [Actinobacteria bacterium]|nr:arylsulfatase [Actinomycetota bacterium]
MSTVRTSTEIATTRLLAFLRRGRVDVVGFGGTIGRYYHESEAWWPARPSPPQDAPNVVVVLLDDVGFSQLGCFGSDIDTPVMDGLAANGLRYTNFHTTALCSPTRAALLTGRNHHRNGMGRIIELATGFPGYTAMIPRENGMLPETLVPHGYAAYAVGKWHLTPDDETHLGATRRRWPLGRGFERFYGFFSGETHQFAPALVHDNHFVEPPASIEDGYHLTGDLVDRSIEFLSDLRQVDPAKRFFLYLTTGACHSPHQAPREWIERYRGEFDAGWDAWRDAALGRQIASGVLPEGTRLSPRPDHVPAWADLSDDERLVYARYMEAFAGMLSHTDHELGRLIAHLERAGELDDTLMLVLSDNGASSEGGPEGSLNDVMQWNALPRTAADALERIDDIGGPRAHNNYPWGWTVAGNTPFRRWKRETHEGGVADPLIVHWPAGIGARGQLRRQYVHAIDLAPTILDAVGIEPPEAIDGVAQSSLDGVSFRSTFDDADAAEVRTTQYYEMFGCRAIYHEGWKAVTYHAFMQPPGSFDEEPWELYDLRTDPTELDDLSAAEPERLRAMVQRWWDEAERNQVLPLDDRPLSDLVLDRPDGLPPRSRYVYAPHAGMVPEAAAVNLKNRSHQVTADIEWPDGGAEGVLIAQGSILGGWTLFVRDGALTYVHNLSGHHEDRVSAPLGLGPGAHTVGYRYEQAGHENRGTVRLVVDDAVVAHGDIDFYTPIRWSLVGHGLTVGYDGILAVVEDYASPFRFNGVLHRVVVDVDGEPFVDPEGEAAVAVATQ